MVLVSTADKRKIYDYLLSEGVFCSKKVCKSYKLHSIYVKNSKLLKFIISFISKKDE